MSINDGQLWARWRADLARIAAQIDDLKARIDTESRTLHASLSAKVTELQFDLEKLEAEMDAAVGDSHVRQIAVQIAELSAKGDAAYQLLQTEMAVQLDPTEAEIRRLETIATSASGDAKAKLTERIERLRSMHAGREVSTEADESPGQGDHIPP
jgi:hypothetical protein